MRTLKLALIGATVTPLCHVVVLLASGLDPIETPISELSRTSLAGVHTFGLLSFGVAHLALAHALGARDRGRLWPVARLLLVASGITLFYVAYYFAKAASTTLSGEGANDPLWLVATLIGLAMGTLQPGLARIAPKLALFSTICLGIWLWLVPLILLVDASWLGAYERLVGTVYVVWMTGLSLGLIARSSQSHRL